MSAPHTSIGFCFTRSACWFQTSAMSWLAMKQGYKHAALVSLVDVSAILRCL